MAFLDMIFGPSKGEVRAALQLQKAEDKLLAYDEREYTDLGHHIYRSKQRQNVIVLQLRFNNEQSKRRDNRNFLAVVVMAAFILGKGLITVEQIGHLIAGILGIK